jgi:outer membrane lipoprotein SlyB
MIERFSMSRSLRTGFAAGTAAVLCILMAGCTPDYSPNTYASNAAQQANKVNQGIIVGVRAVQISADTTLATASGGAAGGVIGAGFGEGSGSAAGAAAGAIAGGVVGNVVGHAAGDTDGFEYIVKKSNGDLLSVTQKDTRPLGIGAHVLLIEGPQARIVPDYTVPVVVEALHPEDVKPAPVKSEPAPVAAATAPASQPAIVPAAVTAAPVPGTATTVIATPLPPPAQPATIPPAVTPPPQATSPQTVAVNPPPAQEQKPAAPPEAQTLPAPKPEDTPKPASGS